MSDTLDELRAVGDEMERKALVGSKTGRPDYVAVIPLDQMLRWHRAYAALLAQVQAGDIITPSTAHMSPEERRAGIQQMLADLRQLAERDGCIAAAWAYEALSSLEQGQAPVPTGVDRERINEVRAEMLDAALDGNPVPAETVRMWAYQLKGTAESAQGRAPTKCLCGRAAADRLCPVCQQWKCWYCWPDDRGEDWCQNCKTRFYEMQEEDERAQAVAQGQAPPGHVVVPFETAERIHACLHYQLSEHEALTPELTEADRVFTAALNAARMTVPPQGQEVVSDTPTVEEIVRRLASARMPTTVSPGDDALYEVVINAKGERVATDRPLNDVTDISADGSPAQWAALLAQGQAPPQGVVTLQAPVKVRVIGSQPDQPYEVDVTEDPNGLIVRESAGGGARLITVHQSGNVSEEATTPPGVTVPVDVAHGVIKAIEYALPHMPPDLVETDELRDWGADLAAALGAGKGDAGGG